MADTRPTPVGFFGALRLCFLLLFAPARFIAAQEADAKARNNYSDRVDREHSAYIVRRAFVYSLLLVVLFGALGFVAGRILGAVAGCASSQCIITLQIAGASLLLWGTLFVRGWEIGTYSGVSFTERVNQWLYRALYCVGTGVLVASLAWTPCKP